MFKPNSLADYFSDKLPDEEIVFSEQNITRLAFKNICLNMSRAIKELHVNSVALDFSDQVNFIAAFVSCLSCGVVPVLFAPNEINMSRLRNQYDKLLTDKNQDPVFSPIKFFWKDFLGEQDVGSLSIPTDSKLRFFTSGSTGTPKEITKTVSQMDREARFTSGLFHENLAGKTLASTVDEFHHYGLSFAFWLPIAVGIPFLGKKISFSEDLMGIDRNLALITSPTFLRNLDVSLPIKEVGWVFSAGGKLDGKGLSNVLSFCPSGCTEIYGSTETGIIGHRNLTKDNKTPAWKIPDGMSIDRLGNTLRLKSPFIPNGYFDLEDDLELVNEKEFVLKGRKDKIIKIGERRYNLSDIESQIKNVCKFECSVLPINKNGRQLLGAVLFTTKPITHQDIIDWRKQLLKVLDERAIPRFWRSMSERPYNAQGKVDQIKLMELFND